MQRNINKEIRHYEEDVFMGLSLRQVLWAGVAAAAAVGVYFGFKGILGHETVSWVCIVAAAPFAAAGFFSYDGMNVWQFLAAVIETELLSSGPRVWMAENRYQGSGQRKKKPLPKKANTRPAVPVNKKKLREPLIKRDLPELRGDLCAWQGPKRRHTLCIPSIWDAVHARKASAGRVRRFNQRSLGRRERRHA